MDRETWTFINSFAPWLAALGTTAAVIVSLHLGLRSSRVKLRITSGVYHVTAVGQTIAQSPEYLQIRAVNRGFRDATIQGIMWTYRPFLRRRTLAMIPPVNPYSLTLPGKLSQGDAGSFLFTLDEFRRGAQPLIEIVRSAHFPKLAARRIKVGVYTTTGEEALARVDDSICGLLLGWARETTA